MVVTALTGKDIDEIMGEFNLSEDSAQVLICPMGHTSEKTTYYPKTGMCRAKFNCSCCENCPYREKCRAKEQHKSYVVYVSS